MGWPGLVLKSNADFSIEGAAVGINVDDGIHGGHLGLQQIFVLLEAAFVIGLDVRGAPWR